MCPGATKGRFGQKPNELMEWVIENNSIPEPNSGCWLWTGTLNQWGYGKLAIQKKHWIASRASWTIYNKREIPKGLLVMHKCDTRSCVNPSHLIIGTVQDNSNDMVAKGRSMTGDRNTSRKNPHLQVRGSTHPYSKLTEEDVLQIKKDLSNGVGQRELAKRYGVKPTNISNIKVGLSWRHVVLKDNVDNLF